MDENGLSMKFNKLLAATEARFGELFDVSFTNRFLKIVALLLMVALKTMAALLIFIGKIFQQERMSMDAEQDDLAMKQKVNTELCDRFNDNYPLTELNDVDLNIQAIAAQNELFMARCGQILDTITARQSKRKRTNSVKLGEKLFEERLPDDLPDLLYDKYCEAQFKLHRGKAFNAQTSQWQLSDDFAVSITIKQFLFISKIGIKPRFFPFSKDICQIICSNRPKMGVTCFTRMGQMRPLNDR